MTLATIRPSLLSGRAKEVFDAPHTDWFLLADWSRAVFIHYAVPAEALRSLVPFELDLRDGVAYVSLVAFTMHRLRPNVGGRAVEWLTTPIANHAFLNCRTYVIHDGEPGIFFLAEWLPNLLSVIAGPKTWGLPYRWGTLDYDHDAGRGGLRGRVAAKHGGETLAYEGAIAPDAEYHGAEENSLDEFLFERFAAFTQQRTVRRRFRVWHEPWRTTPVEVTVTDASLLETTGSWARDARMVGAAYSPGLRDVWMSRPECINGPGCGRDWSMELPADGRYAADASASRDLTSRASAFSEERPATR